MEIKFKEATLIDAEELLKVQRESFKESLKLYQDYETNPKFESMDKICFKIQNHYYYTITIDDAIIGGIHAYKKGDGHYFINRIFIHPNYENLGIGQKAMEFIETELPNANILSLDTPHKSYKNHYFYEKLGYKRTGDIEKMNEHISLIQYEKILKRS